ncbi:coil containing protein [Vibrio phage 1.138.O._10N.261.48.A1]|nr:coil containing protein [Vibrio phage 1.138.O._10N.261.48.A1]
MKLKGQTFQHGLTSRAVAMKGVTKPKQIERLESDVRLLSQQLANTTIALVFLKEMGVKAHAEKYIDEILKLSEEALANAKRNKEK